MPKDNEFDYNQQGSTDYEPQEGVGEAPRQANSHEEPGRQPWNNKFGEDENLKNRQFSRSNRNKPKQEASTLSKVVLALVFITCLIPFILYFAVEGNREEPPISQTSSIAMTSTTADESSTTSETTTRSTTTTSREVTSREISETTEATVPQQVNPVATTENYAGYEATSQAIPGGSHVVQAGDTWWNISQRYGVDVYELAAMNGATIDSPLQPGMSLVVP